MKKLLFKLPLVLIFLTTTSCAEVLKEYSLSYDMTMEVSKPNSVIERSETNKKLSPEDLETSLSFQDENIIITWQITKNGFWYSLANKSKKPIKIHSSEIIIADAESGSKKLKKTNETIVVLGKSFREEYLDFYGNLQDTYFPSIIKDRKGRVEKTVYKSLDLLYDRFVNKPIQILIPIEIEGKIYEYTFTFNTNDINISDY